MKKSNSIDYSGATLIVISGVFIFYYICGLIPLDLMWGFNLLRNFSGIFISGLTLLTLLFFFPGFASKIYDSAQAVLKKFNQLPISVRAILIIFMAGLLFYIFRVHVHSLGDGYQRVYQVQKGYLHNPPEPLDFFLHSILYKGLNIFIPVEAETIYTSLSIILGVLFVIMVYLFRFPADTNKSAAAITKWLILSFGGMQIFFGYVESYSLLYAAALLFILFSYAYFSNGTGMNIVALLFGITITSHQSGLIVLPAFIYLVYHHLKCNKPAAFSDKFLPIIIGVTPLLILIGLRIQQEIVYPQYQKGISDMLLPFYSAGEYSVISLEHFLDIVNETLLITPILYFMTPFYFHQDLSNNPRSSFRIFGAFMMVPAGIFLLLMDPKLGFARDWDLFSTPMAIIGTIVILNATRGQYWVIISRHAKVLVIYGSIILTSVWVIMNSSEAKQLNRAEYLLSISERNRGYAVELLAHYYWQIANNEEKALELYYQIDEKNRNARVYDKITHLEYKLGHYQKAIDNALIGLQMEGHRVDLEILCGAAYQKLGQPSRALEHLLAARREEPTRYNIYSYLGNVYLMLDSMDLALAAHKTSISLNPRDATCYFNTAFAFIEAGKFDSAQTYVNAGLKIDPQYANAGIYLQMIQEGLRNQK